MSKSLKSGVVNLNDQAKEASSKMLADLKEAKSTIKIDYSKLSSFIITDYYERYFSKDLKRIVEAHKDSKKHITTKLSKLNQDQLEAISKYLERFSTTETSD